MGERFVGVEEARGQLGRLIEEVAGGADPIALNKRGIIQGKGAKDRSGAPPQSCKETLTLRIDATRG